MAYNLSGARIANFFVKNNGIFRISRASYAGHGHGKAISLSHGREMANGREQVCHFINGDPHYSDRFDYPYPAIRFLRNEGNILALREKEKSDWKKLTLDEKKALEAPNGQWKLVLSLSLVVISAAFLTCFIVKRFINGPMRESLSNENKEIALQKYIDLHVEPITGIGSQWDYENNRWKA